MPKNVDAVALFFIVAALLFAGYLSDHAPVCLAKTTISFNDRVGRHHHYMMLPPVPPAPPLPRLPRI